MIPLIKKHLLLIVCLVLDLILIAAAILLSFPQTVAGILFFVFVLVTIFGHLSDESRNDPGSGVSNGLR